MKTTVCINQDGFLDIKPPSFVGGGSSDIDEGYLDIGNGFTGA